MTETDGEARGPGLPLVTDVLVGVDLASSEVAASTTLGVRPALEAVFPIVRQPRDEGWTIVGAGFFLLADGIFATARHVLRADRGSDPVYDRDLFVPHLSPDGIIRQRWVAHTFEHPDADVAIGLLEPWEGASNPVLPVTSDTSAAGSEFVGISYHASHATEDVPDGSSTPEIHTDRAGEFGSNFAGFRIRQSIHPGKVMEFHSVRAPSLVNGPAYEVRMEMPFATSGGPVLDRDGRVFGLCSAAGIGNPIVSDIRSVLAMDLSDWIDPVEGDRSWVEDLHPCIS